MSQKLPGPLSQGWRDHWPFLAVLLSFILLGNIYNVITPIFEASDELWHYPFVKHLADGGGLPIQDSRTVQPWRQEGSQPPLTYALGALATFWINTDDLEEIQWENPHARIGVPLAHGNKNMMIHTEKESFPYRGTTLAVHIIRFLSVLLAAGSLLFTYLITLEIFPSSRYLATLASAIQAFNPMFLFIAASVSNDSLVALISSLSLWLVVRILKYGPTTRRLLTIGVILGLGALSKLSALALSFYLPLILGYIALRRKSLWFFLKANLLVLAPAVAIASWWYIRNIILYGDILGLNVMVAIVGGRGTVPGILQLLPELQGFWITYWSLFGGVNLLSAPWVYSLFSLITFLALLGLGFMARRWWKEKRAPEAPYLGLLAVWVLILLAALVRWTQMTYASTGRLIFPGISVVSLFLALGLSHLLGRRLDKWLLATLGTIIFAVALITPFLYIAPAYARPPLLSPETLESIPHRLDANFGGVLELLGHELAEQAVTTGDSVYVTLYWQSTALMDKDYSISVKVFGPGNESLGQVDTYPGLGTFPTTLWEVGDAIADTYAIPIVKKIPYPSAGVVEVTVYKYPTFETLKATDPQGRSVGRVIIGRVRLSPRRPPTYEITRRMEYNFGNEVTLVGYGIDQTETTPGGILHLTLYWEARREMKRDYTVFTHLIDEEGKIWAQKDNQPVGGEYPTSLWAEGEVVKDEYYLDLKPQTAHGWYSLEVGIYHLEGMQRLPLIDPTGEISGDRGIITQVHVR